MLGEITKILHGQIVEYKPAKENDEPSEWRSYYVGKEGIAFICRHIGTEFYTMKFVICSTDGENAYAERVLTTSYGDLFINDNEYTLYTQNSIYKLKSDFDIEPGPFTEDDPHFAYKRMVVALMNII